MRAKLAAKMIAVDLTRAKTSLEAWAVFLRQATAHTRNEPFWTMKEYVPWRVIDAGEM